MPDESRVKPQPLQPEELKAIEARCEAATSGPWSYPDEARLQVIADGVPVCDVGFWTDDAPNRDEINGRFIAAARTDIPRLLATIEEMAVEVAQSHVTVRKNAELALENKNLSEQIEKTTLAHDLLAKEFNRAFDDAEREEGRVLALERELAKRDKCELRIREEMVGWLKSQRVDGYSAGLAEATTRIFAILDTATIEEARREPVRVTGEMYCVVCGDAQTHIPGEAACFQVVEDAAWEAEIPTKGKRPNLNAREIKAFKLGVEWLAKMYRRSWNNPPQPSGHVSANSPRVEADTNADPTLAAAPKEAE